jgi:F-type H+-transporting ATPase subunit delta
MRGAKKPLQFAKGLLQISMQDGRVSAERVSAVLAHLEANPPRQALATLKAYHRLVVREIARSEARIEHAGDLPQTSVEAIAAAFTSYYNRPITAVARRNDELIAGVRARIGSDVFEQSISGQLDALSGAI